MTISFQSRKQKGMQGEYEVRDLLQVEVNKIYEEWNSNLVLGIGRIEPPTLRRNLEQRRSGGSDLDGLSWLALEVKRQENDSMINQWWDQCKSAAVNDRGVYVKTPVLIWRQNHCPWRVRMFGFLIVIDKPGGTRVQLPVDINLQGFLAYFRARVISALGRSLNE